MKLWKDTARGKKCMAAFKLNDISLVDKPAQEHAKIALLKRDYKDKNMEKQTANSPSNYDQKPTSFADAIEMMAERFPFYTRVQAIQAAQAQYPELFDALPSGATAVIKSKDDASKAFSMLTHCIAKRDNISLSQAMTVTRNEYPDLYKAMQQVGRDSKQDKPITTTQKLAARAANADPRDEFVTKFNDKVTEIQKSNRGLSRTQAMSKARKAYPELFENAFQEYEVS